MTLSEHQQTHRQVMQAICEVIQEGDKPLVLKGGTALLLGYDLKRFSEDLDFDLTKELKSHVNIEAICKSALQKLGRQGVKVRLTGFRELKKTDTTHRCRAMFEAGVDMPPLPLKIEVSSRTLPAKEAVRVVNGIKVYAVQEIARQKLLAAREDESRPYRTAARDLHDLAFIAGQWERELPKALLAELEAFFDSPEKLVERYADAYDDDPLLQGQLFDDLGAIERWLKARRSNAHDTLNLFGPS